MQLFEINSDKADKAIANLSTKREFIADKLEALKLAIGDYCGTESIKADVFDFLALKSLDEVKAKIAKRWIEEENVSLPIEPIKAYSVMTITPEIKQLVSAWEEVNGRSENPSKYWSDTKMAFRAVPVSESEKERIREQCKFYLDSVDSVMAMSEIAREVRLINFSNTHLGDIYLEQAIYTLKPHLKGLIKRKYNSYAAPHIFELDIERFLVKPKVEPVFDQ